MWFFVRKKCEMSSKMSGFFILLFLCSVSSCLAGNSTVKSHSNVFVFSINVVPNMDGKTKGESGKIGVIGGSLEYTGAPFFAAMSALKVGADLVYVITTESAAPTIKSYSPDLIVYPFLHKKDLSMIEDLIPKFDVVVLGPGLGRENDTMRLVYSIIERCKRLEKPLVIDADGLYAVSLNPQTLRDYPAPGAILTPNVREAEILKQGLPSNIFNWYYYWGENVAILVKGQTDRYYSLTSSAEWQLTERGSPRRSGGQGDILAGALGTFYGWSLKALKKKHLESLQQAQSIASSAAAYLTRDSCYKAYEKHGRSMCASDMLKEIHAAFIFMTGKN